MRLFFVYLALVLGASACEGPAGPMGERFTGRLNISCYMTFRMTSWMMPRQRFLSLREGWLSGIEIGC